MSLIADALKRAQEERSGGRRDDKARRLLTRPGPVRVATERATKSPAVMGAGAALAASLVVLSVVAAGAFPRAGSGPVEGAVLAAGAGTSGARGPGSTESAGVVGPETDAESPQAEGDAGSVPPTAAAPSRVGAPVTGEPPSTYGQQAGHGNAPAPARGLSRVGDDPGAAPPAVAPGGAPGGAPSEARVAHVPGARSFTLSVERGADAGQLFTRALAAQQAGDLVAAAELYAGAVAARPSDPQLHNNLGTVYRGLGRSEEALSSFRSAVEADPRYAPAWSNLGMVLEGLGRAEEAVEAFRSALRVDPSNLGAKVNLANKYHELGVEDEARRLLTEALRADPSFPEAHYGMARVLETGGDVTGAVRHYRLFLGLARGRFPALESRVADHVSRLEVR
jgi:Tfp pilus assembly protein PilF